jgi:hypothetical protein
MDYMTVGENEAVGGKDEARPRSLQVFGGRRDRPPSLDLAHFDVDDGRTYLVNGADDGT